MAVYTLIAGVDGVGKTSFLGALVGCAKDIGVVVQDDLCKISECIRNGVSFVRKSTLDSDIDDQIMRMARDAGYQVRLCYIAIDTAADCLARIQNRVRHGGADVPTDTVIQRFNTRWDTLSKVLTQCNSVEIYDNDNGFSKVAEYQNDRFCAVERKIPTWLEDLLAFDDSSSYCRKRVEEHHVVK